MARKLVLIMLLTTWSVDGMAGEFGYQAQVEGMVCAFCAYSVNKKISALPGVETGSVDVDLKSGEVVFRSSSPVSEDSLESILADSGFSLFDLDETTVPRAAAQSPSILALDLKIESLDMAEIGPLLEEVGNLAAARLSRIVIHAPSASEPEFLQPILMGRQQVMKLQYIPTDDNSAHLQLYLAPQ